jgi:NifU-like protein involved in Fe-S cluster formation
MSEDLYAKELLRWAADVSCAGSISGEKLSATVNNAMCGDRITLDFAVDPTHEIYECRHDTKACVLTQASASILAAHAVGETGESLAHFACHIVLGATKQFSARDRHDDGVHRATCAT